MEDNDGRRDNDDGRGDNDNDYDGRGDNDNDGGGDILIAHAILLCGQCRCKTLQATMSQVVENLLGAGCSVTIIDSCGNPPALACAK